MNETNKHLEDLTHIRSLMDRSSRFLSLSGLSGIFAGTYALIGATAIYLDAGAGYLDFMDSLGGVERYKHNIVFLLGVAMTILTASLITGFLFTYRKAKKQQLKIWDNAAKRMMSNLFVPLVTGGILGLALMYYHLVGLIAPITLIFYGLGLYSASKYSFIELRYLGLCEIALGLIACFNIGYGLLFWSIGFGLLHIIYGALMYFKYERKGIT